MKRLSRTHSNYALGLRLIVCLPSIVALPAAANGPYPLHSHRFTFKAAPASDAEPLSLLHSRDRTEMAGTARVHCAPTHQGTAGCIMWDCVHPLNYVITNQLVLGTGRWATFLGTAAGVPLNCLGSGPRDFSRLNVHRDGSACGFCWLRFSLGSVRAAGGKQPRSFVTHGLIILTFTSFDYVRG